MTMRNVRSFTAAAALAMASGGCATLSQIVQPPQLSVVEGRDSELRLVGPSSTRPMGGATLRIWTRVQNPNAFGLTLSALQGSLFLESQRAGEVSFPLGLPLAATSDTIIPLDVTVSFADLPELAEAVQRIVTRNTVAYRLDGTIAVDAAPFGQPTFGPSTWLQGQSRVIR